MKPVTAVRLWPSSNDWSASVVGYIRADTSTAAKAKQAAVVQVGPPSCEHMRTHVVAPASPVGLSLGPRPAIHRPTQTYFPAEYKSLRRRPR
ncbi:protein of unknown function [Paraburkholderia dioscoreae]|uniref:Uncharacterized protein n=1 Tax=Paraburkholderia dioscoreae TaxID=2604047 RepID=A0A5Q4ZID9_9BURK|nr:protein of unknown function [Paraburkholderia dioscoreae]